MIYQLSGVVCEIIQNLVVLDVRGVGYGVNVPERLIGVSFNLGEEAKVFTVTIVSQDNLQLFGFTSSLDRHFFKMLLKIPRIGPKGALKILSSSAAVNIMQKILSGDRKSLSKLPGIGPKVAQRLVLELQEKVKKVLEKEDVPYEDKYEEIRETLIELGCSEIEAREVIEKVKKEKDIDSLSFDEMLNLSLSILAHRELDI